MNPEQHRKLRLLDVHQEEGDVKTFKFEKGDLSWVAGQSQEYILKQAGETMDENSRRFTISSAPSEATVNITTRITQSVYKQTLSKLAVDEEIECYALEGDFTWEGEESVVLVAGGIGVTPFRSILIERDAKGKKLNCTLLYFNRISDIPLLGEFEKLAGKHPEFKFKPLVGEPITAEKIVEMAPVAKTQTVYLSGPEPMVEAVGNALKAMGITTKLDHFPGYNEKNF